MADSDLKISQRHYDVILTTPAPDVDSFPEVTTSIERLAEIIDEYVMLEDATADFDIEFTAAPLDDLLSTSRDRYTIEVKVGRNVGPKQILEAIAADLVEIYDEQDSEYTDDLLDMRVALDLYPSSSVSSSPPPSEKKKKRKRKSTKKKETSDQTPLFFETTPDVEETVEAETTPEVEETIEVETTPEVQEAVEVETTPEVQEIVEEDTYPYPDIFRAIFENPNDMGKALEINAESLEETDLATATLTVTSIATDSLINRVHDILVRDSIRNKRAPSTQEMALLLWMVACRNLTVKDSLKAKAELYSDSIFFDRKVMISLNDKMSGRVYSTIVPGYKKSNLASKALVILESDTDLYDLGSNAEIQSEQAAIERQFVSSFLECIGQKNRKQLQEAVGFLNTRADLLKALELAEIWESLDRSGERSMAIVTSIKESTIKRVHKAIVKVCKSEDRVASPQELSLLADMLTIYGLSEPIAEEEIESSVESGKPFVKSKMQSVSGEKGIVERTLMAGIPKFKLKPLVRLVRESASENPLANLVEVVLNNPELQFRGFNENDRDQISRGDSLNGYLRRFFDHFTDQVFSENRPANELEEYVIDSLISYLNENGIEDFVRDDRVIVGEPCPSNMAITSDYEFGGKVKKVLLRGIYDNQADKVAAEGRLKTAVICGR